MGKLTDDKLDDFFRSKLTDFETEPDENYWPAIEAGTDGSSFFKFGWKHFNIYNSLIAAATLTALAFWFTFTPEEKIIELPAPADTVISLPENSQVIPEIKTEKKSSLKNTPPDYTDPQNTLKVSPQEENIPAKPDSFINIPVEKKTEVADEPVVKPKPEKRVIYIVEQDTIVEKDTVRVRRKKKK